MRPSRRTSSSLSLNRQVPLSPTPATLGQTSRQVSATESKSIVSAKPSRAKSNLPSQAAPALQSLDIDLKVEPIDNDDDDDDLETYRSHIEPPKQIADISPLNSGPSVPKIPHVDNLDDEGLYDLPKVQFPNSIALISDPTATTSAAAVETNVNDDNAQDDLISELVESSRTSAPKSSKSSSSSTSKSRSRDLNKIPFDLFCKLLAKISSASRFPNPNEVKRTLLEKLFSQIYEPGVSMFPVLRLLLPHLDDSRTSYGLREVNLAGAYIHALSLDEKSLNARRLKKFKDPQEGMISGDFGTVLADIMGSRYLPAYKTVVTVGDVNDMLDDLAHSQRSVFHRFNPPENSTKSEINFRGTEKTDEAKENSPAQPAIRAAHLSELERSALRSLVFKHAIQIFSPLEHCFFARIILKDMKIGMRHETILKIFDPAAMSVFNAISSLRIICEIFSHPDVKQHLEQSASSQTASQTNLPLKVVPLDAAGKIIAGVANDLNSELTLLASHLRSLASGMSQIQYFQAFRPMLCSSPVWEKVLSLRTMSAGYFVEPKFDGERVLLHKAGNRIELISRRGIHFNPYYHQAMKVHIIAALGNHSCILDGEILSFNPQTQRFEAFGSNKSTALLQSATTAADTRQRLVDSSNRKGLARTDATSLDIQFSLDDPPAATALTAGKSADSHFCFVAFDILRHFDTSLVHHPLRIRKEFLRRIVTPVESRFHIAALEDERKIQTNDSLLSHLLNITNLGLEGIIIKSAAAPYLLNDRSDSWVKIKPDLVTGLRDNLDLVVVGGYYGSRSENEFGAVSHFLLACLAEPLRDRESYLQRDPITNAYVKPMPPIRIVAKVGSGYSRNLLSYIQSTLRPHMKKYDNDRRPAHLLSWNPTPDDRPDLWIDIRDSIVFELKCFELAPSDRNKSFNAGFTPRFPRLQSVRDDKDWSDIMTLQQVLDLATKSSHPLNPQILSEVQDQVFKNTIFLDQSPYKIPLNTSDLNIVTTTIEAATKEATTTDYLFGIKKKFYERDREIADRAITDENVAPSLRRERYLQMKQQVSVQKQQADLRSGTKRKKFQKSKKEESDLLAEPQFGQPLAKIAAPVCQSVWGSVAQLQPNTALASTIFAGLTFAVLSLRYPFRLEDVQILIQMHGGKVVVKEGSNCNFLICSRVDALPARVAVAVAGNYCDILDVSWIYDSVLEAKRLPVSTQYLIHCLKSTQELISKEMDRFGDSYTKSNNAIDTVKVIQQCLNAFRSSSSSNDDSRIDSSSIFHGFGYGFGWNYDGSNPLKNEKFLTSFNANSFLSLRATGKPTLEQSLDAFFHDQHPQSVFPAIAPSTITPQRFKSEFAKGESSNNYYDILAVAKKAIDQSFLKNRPSIQPYPSKIYEIQGGLRNALSSRTQSLTGSQIFILYPALVDVLDRSASANIFHQLPYSVLTKVLSLLRFGAWISDRLHQQITHIWIPGMDLSADFDECSAVIQLFNTQLSPGSNFHVEFYQNELNPHTCLLVDDIWMSNLYPSMEPRMVLDNQPSI